MAVNGTRYRQSLETSDHREAKAKEKELVAQIQAGKVATATGKAFARLPFDQAADKYLAGRENRVSERTVQFEKERLVPLGRYFRISCSAE